jgi:hypothetical protein
VVWWRPGDFKQQLRTSNNWNSIAINWQCFWFSKELEYIAMQYFQNKTLQFIRKIGKSQVFLKKI